MVPTLSLAYQPPGAVALNLCLSPLRGRLHARGDDAA